MPTVPQNRTRTDDSLDSYDPSQVGYYFGPNRDQWKIQEQQRKQKEQPGYQVGYDIRSNQDQYQLPGIPINPPETASKQDQYLQKIREDERKREQ